MSLFVYLQVVFIEVLLSGAPTKGSPSVSILHFLRLPVRCFAIVRAVIVVVNWLKITLSFGGVIAKAHW